ncbi:MAG: hypothetical protein IPP83_15020 [Flavobacteriales bacterium]|nr:hypothetical protein [Flavobacteriales bacterium]
MNQGTLDRTRFERIEAYVLGSMSVDEHALFEQELASDPALKAEMELQRENTLTIELGGMDRLLKSVSTEQRANGADLRTQGAGWKSYLKYAAIVAIVLSGAFWVMTRPTTNERLFAQHFEADPGLPVAMGSTTNLAFSDAMVAYKLGDYQEARDKWSILLKADPANDTLRYYIGSAALAMDDADAAIPFLERVAADPGSAFHDKAMWYLFLAYVQQGELAKAKALPLDNDTAYGERARAIKAELE